MFIDKLLSGPECAFVKSLMQFSNMKRMRYSQGFDADETFAERDDGFAVGKEGNAHYYFIDFSSHTGKDFRAVSCCGLSNIVMGPAWPECRLFADFHRLNPVHQARDQVTTCV